MKLVHPSSLVHPSVIIGKDTTIVPFCNIMADCIIGDNTKIGQNVFMDHGVSVGNNVVIGNNVSFCSGTTIEDDVYIGSTVVFSELQNTNPLQPKKLKQPNPLVRHHARISPNVTVFHGSAIGKYAFVGAGAVITKPVADYAIIVGNPSRQIGWISESGSRLSFVNNIAACLLTGTKYLLEGKKVRKV